MTAIHVGVRSRIPRDWGDLVAPGSGGFRAAVSIGVQVAYAVCVAMLRPVGCLGVVSRPSSRDASSKATPVYHPRG